jgi:rRNA-processing protein FCF1
LIELYAGVIYDFQLNTFRIKVYSNQTKSDYFTENANSIEELKAKIIQQYFSLLQPADSLKSERQQKFEEKTCEIQSESDYLLYQNKPQEAIEKRNQYYKEAEVIENENFWQNIDAILYNNITEVFFNIPEFCEAHNKALQKLSKVRPDLRIFLAYQTILKEIDDSVSTLFWINNSPFSKFGCFINDWLFSELPYFISFGEKTYTTGVITKQRTDNKNNINSWKKRFAQKYIPQLLTEATEFLNGQFDISAEGIEKIHHSDKRLNYFKNWSDEFGFASDFENLWNLKAGKINELKVQHKSLLLEKFNALKDEIGIEKIEEIEKIDQITKIKNQVESIGKECFDDYVDILEQINNFKKKVSEQEIYIKEQLLAKHYIIDTNVFIDCPEILSKIDTKHNVVLSAKVVDELDKLKRKLKGDKKENVEKALKLINQKLGKKKNIKTARANLKLLPSDFNDKSPDNLILCVALMYKDNNPCLLTSDNGLQAKAKICDIQTISLQEFITPWEKGKEVKKITVIKRKKDEKRIASQRLIDIYKSILKNGEDSVLMNEFQNAITHSIEGFSHSDYGFNKFNPHCNPSSRKVVIIKELHF